MPELPTDQVYPEPLQEIIDHFEGLPEQERRENLMSFSQSAGSCEPGDGESFDVKDDRKDRECTDRVGVFVRIDSQEETHIRISLGPNVQTLTRAMTAILCRGLSGQSPNTILKLPPDFVPRIIGEELIRMRARTVYYILDRIKEAVRKLV